MNYQQMRKRQRTKAFVAMTKGQITPKEYRMVEIGWMRISEGSLWALAELSWAWLWSRVRWLAD